MGIYSSFDIGQMLNVIRRHADDVRLTPEITGDDGDWTLYVFDEKYGEFEQTGSLFRVVMSAFKPYLNIAKQERKELSDKLGGVFGNRETFIPIVDSLKLNDDMKFILGRPNFWCGGVAPALRAHGYEIPAKAEEEQAAVIHFLLNQYLTHGDEWRDKTTDILWKK
ncbi:hypothetical protein [Vibrio parahaemolyticus]|uniref:hypothetical protein n=1 Tax=Vibrio parahaemolyticus TaxID=670 RepID=UPI002555F0E5|nr:hypothetical protein [Vibrio parahaemolyticus]